MSVFFFFFFFIVINAENAAHKSEKFSALARRTRYEYLKDLATNYVTNTTLETGAKGKGKGCIHVYRRGNGDKCFCSWLMQLDLMQKLVVNIIAWKHLV